MLNKGNLSNFKFLLVGGSQCCFLKFFVMYIKFFSFVFLFGLYFTCINIGFANFVMAEKSLSFSCDGGL